MNFQEYLHQWDINTVFKKEYANPARFYSKSLPWASFAVQALNTHPSRQIISFSTQDIAGPDLQSSDKQPQRVYSSLVLHIPLFSLFTFPLVRFDNQLNEGEVFTEAVCLLPIADFRGGSCVVTCGLRTKLLC